MLELIEKLLVLLPIHGKYCIFIPFKNSLDNHSGHCWIVFQSYDTVAKPLFAKGHIHPHGMLEKKY